MKPTSTWRRRSTHTGIKAFFFTFKFHLLRPKIASLYPPKYAPSKLPAYKCHYFQNLPWFLIFNQPHAHNTRTTTTLIFLVTDSEISSVQSARISIDQGRVCGLHVHVACTIQSGLRCSTSSYSGGRKRMCPQTVQPMFQSQILPCLKAQATITTHNQRQSARLS